MWYPVNSSAFLHWGRGRRQRRSKARVQSRMPEGEDAGRLAVPSCVPHAKQTPQAKRRSLSKQTNAIFREMIILGQNIKSSHSSGKDKVRIIYFGLKGKFMHRWLAIRHGDCANGRRRRVTVLFKVLPVLLKRGPRAHYKGLTTLARNGEAMASLNYRTYLCVWGTLCPDSQQVGLWRPLSSLFRCLSSDIMIT